MNEYLKRRLTKLAKRYLRTVREYKHLKQLHDARPLLTEAEFKKIEARMASLNKECDYFEKEIERIKQLREG